MSKNFRTFLRTQLTAEGTGSGLSLGYDIIKAHEGEFESGNKGEFENLFQLQMI